MVSRLVGLSSRAPLYLLQQSFLIQQLKAMFGQKLLRLAVYLWYWEPLHRSQLQPAIKTQRHKYDSGMINTVFVSYNNHELLEAERNFRADDVLSTFHQNAHTHTF